MKFDKVIVKQVPDEYAAMTGLGKYNRSKMPLTSDFLQAAIGPDGRAITGIDENALSLNSIKDEKERAEVRTKIKELRESLEALTGKDLSATSSFWNDFGVKINGDSDLILNKENPLHQIMYHLLVANGYAAPDKDTASHPAYRFAKYYCHVEARAQEEEATTRIARDKIKAKLIGLYENPDKMLLIGNYLEGDKYKAGMSPKTLYNMLSNFVDNSKEPNNIKLFAKAVDLDVEDLQFKIIVDKAIKKKIISYKGGVYQRGAQTFGKSPMDVYNNLRKPEFATDFLLIKEEIESLV